MNSCGPEGNRPERTGAGQGGPGRPARTLDCPHHGRRVSWDGTRSTVPTCLAASISQ
ncbi:hypothetical protein GPA10_34780 [Streptomyces sp. p1417]|uniref:Uncharacterized protein n=1 Tax=Streptomyces typhae TaxID=2681492 RepID=A0A6L6X862_9ACTN|nr:hypothetical protein [Streptomyces typhae]